MGTQSTVLITGGNRGIGLALTQQLSQRGERVIVACRQGSDELNALVNDESRSVQFSNYPNARKYY